MNENQVNGIPRQLKNKNILAFLMLFLSTISNLNAEDRIPEQFGIQKIENDLTWNNNSFKNVVILKWKKEIDNRPLYIESAIILANYNGKNALAHIYRHPKEERPEPKWYLATVYDDPDYKGMQELDGRR